MDAQHAAVYFCGHYEEGRTAVHSDVACQKPDLQKPMRQLEYKNTPVNPKATRMQSPATRNKRRTCAVPKVSQNSRNFWFDSAFIGVVYMHLVS
jgi:hypothetical protein